MKSSVGDTWHFGTDPDADPGCPNHTDPTDPDPEHWKKVFKKNKTEEIKLFLTIIAWWRKDPDPELDPEPGPYLWLTDPDAVPGGQKTYGSYGFGSGCVSPTMKATDRKKRLFSILWAAARFYTSLVWTLKFLCKALEKENSYACTSFQHSIGFFRSLVWTNDLNRRGGAAAVQRFTLVWTFQKMHTELYTSNDLVKCSVFFIMFRIRIGGFVMNWPPEPMIRLHNSVLPIRINIQIQIQRNFRKTVQYFNF